MRSFIVLWLLALAGISWGRPGAGASAAKAGNGAAAKPGPLTQGLDTARIHALYMDGEFDQAIEALELARKQKRIRTRADSLFALKHLAVMYAATYATVEKGKQFMVLLLTLDPAAGILDMQASDMIYMIFRNVQSELAHARHKPDTSQAVSPANDTVAAGSRSRSGRRQWPYWTAGSVALAVGAGAILYFTVFDPEPRNGEHFDGGLP
jgi:hypothetical protein